jgi:glycosyltransferase involved in cell wall biosynthesis
MPASFGFLSSYPPTQCGLATFTAALRTEIAASGHPTGVVRVLERADAGDATSVHHMVHGQAGAAAAAAAVLNRFDVVVIQHEYGIYDGPDGDSVVEVLDRLVVPSIVVLHTVLVDPSRNQRRVLNAVARRASALVTMTRTARQRLLDNYDVDDTKVVVIPHGASDAGRYDRTPWAHAHGPLMLTWGLLGPGKGIERVIEALPSLRELEPRPHYLVVGETHPRVLEREGESYRQWLVARAEQLGVGDMVTFRPGYLDVATLGSLAAAADVVILPYDSREQVTSGVLIEAVTARRPVIATAFAHAVELLGSGAGLLVDHDDPDAMGAAIRQVLYEPAQAASMAKRAAVLAPDLLWPAVAARYRALAASVVRADEVAVA